MTQGQQEVMDIIAHMTPKELQELAGMIVEEVQRKLKVDATNKALHFLRTKDTLQKSRAAKRMDKRQGLY